MQQATTAQQQNAFTFIKGYAGQEQLLQQTINATWQIAYTALWNGVILNSNETKKCKQLIRTWLLQGDDLVSTYTELVQRIMLARAYVMALPNRFVPLPSEWFCLSNEKGLAGTKAWFAKLQFKRLAMPLYKIELKAFAEAILELAEEPTTHNFHYWREYFIERGWQALLNVYLAVVANMEYDGRG